MPTKVESLETISGFGIAELVKSETKLTDERTELLSQIRSALYANGISEESEDDNCENSISTAINNPVEAEPERKDKHGLLEEKLSQRVEQFHNRPIVDFFEVLQSPLFGDFGSSEVDEVREQYVRMFLLEKKIEELQILVSVLAKAKIPKAKENKIKQTDSKKELKPKSIPKKKMDVEIPVASISQYRTPRSSPKPKPRPLSAKTMRRLTEMAAIYGISVDSKKGTLRPTTPVSKSSTFREQF